MSRKISNSHFRPVATTVKNTVSTTTTTTTEEPTTEEETTVEETTEEETTEEETTVEETTKKAKTTTTRSSVYNNCMCVPTGTCPKVGGNSTKTNDGAGQIDIRIVNVRLMKCLTRF